MSYELLLCLKFHTDSVNSHTILMAQCQAPLPISATINHSR